MECVFQKYGAIMIEPSRRGFITGLISLVAAPAVVRAGSLMPVRGDVLDWREVIRSAPEVPFTNCTALLRCYTVIGFDAFGRRASEDIEWTLMPHTSQTKFSSITGIEVHP